MRQKPSNSAFNQSILSDIHTDEIVNRCRATQETELGALAQYLIHYWAGGELAPL